jgi:outer membrane biosynthesis protein TonB
MVAQQSKLLRVIAVVGGRTVDDRVVPARQTVTIGSSTSNTIVVPRSGLPDSATLFAWQGDRWLLAVPEGAKGRVDGPQGPADLATLVTEGRARKEGGAWLIPVGLDQQGTLVVGAVEVRWQFVDQPAATAAPLLPKTVTGNHFRSMDRLFVSLLALSFLLHGGAYLALASTALPAEVTLEQIPDRYAKLLIPERVAAPPPKEEAPGEAKAEEKKPKGDGKKEQRAETAEEAAARKAARAAAVARAVQSKGMLKVLGALGPGTGTGAVADVFGAGGGIGDVATALSGAGGVAVSADPVAGGGRKGGGQGGVASIGDLATSGGGKVGYGAKAEARVSGSVAAEEADVDSSEIDQSGLAAFVRARMGLIKACYENALKRNPGLRGKLSIRFTILETGGLADVQAAVTSLGSPEVAACIMNTMRTWRTPFRPTGPVTVEYPFVFAPVN